MGLNKQRLFICLNAAEEIIQLVVGDENNLLAGMEAKSDKKGIILIPKMIQQCLDIANLHIDDIAKLVCVIGPGSFTGLRISLSILTGISMGRKIPIGGIKYLDLLAQNAYLYVSGKVYVITYAKINLVYVQGFSGPSPVSPLGPPKVCRVDEIKKLLPQGERIYLVGSGVRRYLEVFKKSCDVEILPSIFDKPSFESLLLAGKNVYGFHEPPKPLYLRPSDAEENFEKIAKNRGLL
jgi:tRNA threonylcarbamoyl adenosine modification protein YeaZ